MMCLNMFAFSLINKPLFNHSFHKPLFRQVCMRMMASAYQSPQNSYSPIGSEQDLQYKMPKLCVTRRERRKKGIFGVGVSCCSREFCKDHLDFFI